MADPTPRVSVLIPAYNAVSFVGRAIESVLAQSMADFELLLIDDASTDETLAVMQGYAADSRVRILHHAQNKQRPATRSEGVAAARGRYLAMLDADDMMLPGRLQRQADFLDEYRRIDVVGSWWQRIDEAGRELPPKRSRRYLDSATVSAYLLFRCAIHNPTIMARRDTLAGYPYDPAFPIAEDYDLWVRMLPLHRFAILPQALMAYREHSAQVSTAQAADSLRFRQCIQARQLRMLGLHFDTQDVVRHSLLYTGRRLYRQTTGEPMGLAYVQWAEDWLSRILKANADAGCYDAPALQRLVARLWATLCRKAARGSARMPVWRVFLASPLSRGLPRAVCVDGWQAAQGRLGRRV